MLKIQFATLYYIFFVNYKQDFKLIIYAFLHRRDLTKIIILVNFYGKTHNVWSETSVCSQIQ